MSVLAGSFAFQDDEPALLCDVVVRQCCTSFGDLLWEDESFWLSSCYLWQDFDEAELKKGNKETRPVKLCEYSVLKSQLLELNYACVLFSDLQILLSRKKVWILHDHWLWATFCLLRILQPSNLYLSLRNDDSIAEDAWWLQDHSLLESCPEMQDDGSIAGNAWLLSDCTAVESFFQTRSDDDSLIVSMMAW